MKIARVFPRKTRATPFDATAFVGEPPLGCEMFDKIHISATFTWDMPEVDRLARAWKFYGAVNVGGPAMGTKGGEFEPGKYLAPGYIITSRGCPNKCWFCSVPAREGNLRELQIRDGWNVLDDNLLACSKSHINGVFDMLTRQERRAEFTGGLEAARLKSWHIDRLTELKPRQMFFAYDTPDDYEPLVEAGKNLLRAGFTFQSHSLRAYVLIGYPRDTFYAANVRLNQTIDAGFLPMAMLWRSEDGEPKKEWKIFQRQWARPAIICARRLKEP